MLYLVCSILRYWMSLQQVVGFLTAQFHHMKAAYLPFVHRSRLLLVSNSRHLRHMKIINANTRSHFTRKVFSIQMKRRLSYEKSSYVLLCCVQQVYHLFIIIKLFMHIPLETCNTFVIYNTLHLTKGLILLIYS